MERRDRTRSQGRTRRSPKTIVRKRDKATEKSPERSSAKTFSKHSAKDTPRVWRSDKKDSRSEVTSEDKMLLAAASAKIGPGGYKKFSDIPAHKLGRKLRVKLYALTKQFPKDEKDNLVIRIKTASTTLTAALVTGFGQGTFRSAISGALESRGVLFGIQDYLDQAEQYDYLDGKQRESLRVEVDDVIDALNKYLGELARDRDRFMH